MDALAITVPYAIRLYKPSNSVVIIQMDEITFDSYPIPYGTRSEHYQTTFFFTVVIKRRCGV